MTGVQSLVAQDLFSLLDQTPSHGLAVFVSFFEIYGGRCQDLLNNRCRLNVREDGKGEVVVAGLEEVEVENVDELLGMIELGFFIFIKQYIMIFHFPNSKIGNRNRTTHATENNDVSSRSHAICQITLRTIIDEYGEVSGPVHGKLSLIDLGFVFIFSIFILMDYILGVIPFLTCLTFFIVQLEVKEQLIPRVTIARGGWKELKLTRVCWP